MSIRTVLAAAAFLTLVGCASLPDEVERTASQAFADPLSTGLGQVTARLTDAHPEQSAIVLLDTGRDAFTHRAALIETAERAIDAQYYIWDADQSGKNLAARMLAAADPGVRVRVLLDDLGIGSKDRVLYALDTHPQIEIRLYNPLPAGARSGLVALGTIVVDFDRLAPRMHSKLMLVDGSIAIVGGRNIADQYFDLHDERNFRDRDVLLAGPLVPESGAAFDTAWASWSSFPIAAVSSVRPDADEVRSVLDALRALDASTTSPIDAPSNAADAQAFIDRSLQSATWARAELIVNRPLEKGEVASFEELKKIANRIKALVENTRNSLLIESGYVISGEIALDLYAALNARGTRVQILTNSLASNDVIALHAGYSRTRRAMLERGVELHELRPDAASCVQLIGTVARCAPSARLALHSKTAVFDDDIVYVGSFNFNPRAAFLNTEYAVIVHSRRFAEQIRNDIGLNLQGDNSWRVTLDDDGALRWESTGAGGNQTHDSEPETTLWRRIRAALFSMLPIERYL